ncbi:MAG: zinc-dependent peptidase [bacterium]|nr:zinc-dependent peptidase [bacterium]
MVFGWGRGRRRRELLATLLPDEQRARLHALAPLTARLPGHLRARHEGVAQVLLAEKRFEGAGGLEVDDDMRLAVAGQAALLQLRAGADFYPGLHSIVIYPTVFTVAHERPDEDGLVHLDEDELSGESWGHGTVVLAWDDVRRESKRRDGYNVVLHEFAHQLDDQTGEGDGTPVLHDRALAARWPTAFQPAFEAHARRLKRRREVLFDEDAAESPAEFFATAVELFFEFPCDLKREYAAVYEVLAAWLELDPAAGT